MSFRALVIPEDPTNNGYILKPLVERMLPECGKPNPKVTILTNPKANGYEHAKKLLLEEVMERWSHMDMLLFLPDADGNDRKAEFENLEGEAKEKGVTLICCAAVEEVEVWLLAGHLSKLSKSWSEIRKEIKVKEEVFESFLQQHGDSRRAGGGRDMLMLQTLKNYSGLIQRCPELAELENRIRQELQGA